jgi:hypothetical protein
MVQSTEQEYQKYLKNKINIYIRNTEGLRKATNHQSHSRQQPKRGKGKEL